MKKEIAFYPIALIPFHSISRPVAIYLFGIFGGRGGGRMTLTSPLG